MNKPKGEVLQLRFTNMFCTLFTLELCCSRRGARRKQHVRRRPRNPDRGGRHSERSNVRKVTTHTAPTNPEHVYRSTEEGVLRGSVLSVITVRKRQFFFRFFEIYNRFTSLSLKKSASLLLELESKISDIFGIQWKPVARLATGFH